MVGMMKTKKTFLIVFLWKQFFHLFLFNGSVIIEMR